MILPYNQKQVCIPVTIKKVEFNVGVCYKTELRKYNLVFARCFSRVHGFICPADKFTLGVLDLQIRYAKADGKLDVFILKWYRGALYFFF